MLKGFCDEAPDIKKRDELAAGCSSSTIFAVDNSRATVANDDSEKGASAHLGENKRPEHEV